MMLHKSGSEIHLDPLNDHFNLSALRNFMQLIKTSIGSCGKLKVIQNIAGGHVTVTSSSIRLYHNLSLKNTFLKFILFSATAQLRSYNDGGLYCTLLTLRLIDNALILSYSKPLVGEIFESLGHMYICCYNHDTNHCVFNIDFSQLIQLQSLVRSFITSKPACLLNEESQKHLCLSLLKIFLNIIPSAPTHIMNKSSIRFHTLEGLGTLQSKLYDGLLLKVPQMLKALPENLIQPKAKAIKVALFNISLSGDADFPVKDIEEIKISVWEELLTHLKLLMAQLVKDKVDVVACQKVIHPTLLKQFQDSGILVLDRLGSEVSKHLQYVSGAEPVMSLSSSISYGLLTSVNQVVIGKNIFLLVKNSGLPFQTFLICNYNEEAVNETKVVCQQALDCMFRLLKESSVCFGGGCTEMCMIHALKRKVQCNISDITKEFGCSESQVHHILQIFLTSITDVLLSIHQGSKLTFATESVYNHLWKMENSNFPVNSAKCMCGQYVGESVPLTKWKLLPDLLTDYLDLSEMPKSPEKSIVDKLILLDELRCKVNASFVAIETASVLLRTTVLINSSS